MYAYTEVDPALFSRGYSFVRMLGILWDWLIATPKFALQNPPTQMDLKVSKEMLSLVVGMVGPVLCSLMFSLSILIQGLP